MFDFQFSTISGFCCFVFLPFVIFLTVSTVKFCLLIDCILQCARESGLEGLDDYFWWVWASKTFGGGLFVELPGIQSESFVSEHDMGSEE